MAAVPSLEPPDEAHGGEEPGSHRIETEHSALPHFRNDRRDVTDRPFQPLKLPALLFPVPLGPTAVLTEPPCFDLPPVRLVDQPAALITPAPAGIRMHGLWRDIHDRREHGTYPTRP
jgi:hypothetical protein